MESSVVSLKLSGEFAYSGKHPRVEGSKAELRVWLEPEGFFVLKYKEEEATGSFASNDEKGHYNGSADQKGEVRFNLAAVERNWKWGDTSEADSGTDVIDLIYSCVLKDDNELALTYLETPFTLRRV